MNGSVDTSDFEKDLDKASDRIQAALEAAIAESAVSIREEAKKLVPRDTGALQNAIVARVKPESARIGVFDRDVYYGAFVEWGTSKQPAQPFMTPAAELERAKLPKRVSVHVKGANK